MRPWHTCAATLLAVLVSAAPPAHAQAYRLDAERDAPALLVAGSLAAGWLLGDQLAPPHCAPLCDRDRLLPVDRWAAGNWAPGFAHASNAVELGILGGSALALVASEPLGHAANDAVVVAEAVLGSDALAAVATLSTRRPRPYVYGTAAPLEERMRGSAALSFFSGHTATCVSATVATARTLQRLGRTTLAGVVLGVGLGASAFVAAGRVASGNHFPTDVVAGAVVGAANGVFWPAIHDRPVAARLAVLDAPGGASLALTGRF